MLKGKLKRRDGIRDCSIMQLDDHTDNGYIAYVEFDPEASSAGAVISIIRETFDKLFPDIPIWVN